MYNPAYLTLSRHNVYYFRWPLPEHLREQGRTAYIKLSLRTRNPKEALMLAKAMAYHSEQLTGHFQDRLMNYAEIKALMEHYLSERLAKMKRHIDEHGPIHPEQLGVFRHGVRHYGDEAEYKATREQYDGVLYDKHQQAFEALELLDLPIPEDPEILDKIQNLYRPAALAYHQAVLDYSNKASTFQLDEPSELTASSRKALITRPQERLKAIINKYVAEMSVAETWGIRAKEERLSCFAYLTELFGTDIPLTHIDTAKARYIKECLLRTPTNRNKLKATRGLPLLQQIEVSGLETLSVGSINKYLQCYKTLYGWAVRNNYITKNPFEGLDIKEGGKSKKKRDWFKPAQTSAMIAELNKGKDGLADTDMKYWGVLIGLYTGARLNEIASLTPNDIKQDAATGIWYFDINDEDEKKRLKTAAATRCIPVHSDLIQRGFIEYVEQVKQQGSTDTRILPNLTYSEKEGWGRKLTRWFSNVYLPRLNLKTDKLSFHSLRHTAITTMRQAGVDNHTIRALVGHEPDGVTEEVYVHGYDLKPLQKAIERINYNQ